MKLGDLRKITAGLPDETELEIRDEQTEELYGVNELESIAFPDDFGEKKTSFWLRLTTNVKLQSDAYCFRK